MVLQDLRRKQIQFCTNVKQFYGKFGNLTKYRCPHFYN